MRNSNFNTLQKVLDAGENLANIVRERDGLRSAVARLTEENRVLREALGGVMRWSGYWSKDAFDRAREALAKADET